MFPAYYSLHLLLAKALPPEEVSKVEGTGTISLLKAECIKL